MAELLGCSQGFLSKVLGGQKELNGWHKTKAAEELGIELDAWDRPCKAAAAEPAAVPPADRGDAPAIEDRAGLARDLTLGQLREVREKMTSVRDPIEWARLARIETAALRTLAELRGEIGNGREMKLRAEIEELKRETAARVALVKETLKAFPEASRAVSAAMRRAFPNEAE